MTQEPKLSQTVARAFDVMQTRLAAREKRMREVAERLQVLYKRFMAEAQKHYDYAPNDLDSPAFDLIELSAKLLEGIPGFESAISEEEDLYTPPSQNIDQ